MCWLFVPKLRADGWLRIGGQEHRVDGEVAYHDHNWVGSGGATISAGHGGRFCPTTREPLVPGLFAMTDRRRLLLPVPGTVRLASRRACRNFPARCGADALHGLLGRPADCTLPAPMRLLLDGDVPDVPALVEIDATRAGDTRPHRVPLTVLRAAGSAQRGEPESVDGALRNHRHRQRHGSINGEPIDFVGTGVFEFLYG